MDRVIDWVVSQGFDWHVAKRMCDLWASDPEYWDGQSLWRMHDEAV